MTHKLLLADDSVTIQRVIELTFADEDVEVITVGDGQLAIDRLDSDPPDIVLADVDMPKRDGYEVAAYVKSRPKLAHIPVVLLTGAFEPIDQARALQAGSTEVLAKPFEPQMVINRVKQLLSKKREAEPPQGVATPPLRPPAAPRPPARSSMAMNDEHATQQDQPARSEPGETTQAPVSLDDYFDKLDAAFSNLQPGAPAIVVDTMRAEDWIDTLPAPVQAPPPARPAPSAPVPPAAPVRSTLNPSAAAVAAPGRPAVNPPATAVAPSGRPAANPPATAVAPSGRPMPSPPVGAPPPAPPLQRREAITPPPSPPSVNPAWAPPNTAAAAAPPAAPRPLSPPPPPQTAPSPVLARAAPGVPPAAAPPPAAARIALNPLAELSAVKADAPLRPAAPAITDEMIEEVVSRVLQRLSDQVIRETVAQIVSKTAERLVEDEIQRIKNEAQ
ncbi:MAG TPA: response regulator [Vicinamibacterales bacterium]|jgi:CheY-like chemotaxis protein|nr:response regulator [Vicinamibacterales bacterium]